jgi:hypothetical protein
VAQGGKGLWNSYPLAKGDALLNRGCHGAGELRFVVEQRIMPGGHGDIHARFQISQPAERTDDPPTDLLDHVCHVGIAGWLTLDKAGFESLVRTIEKNALHEDHMIM